MVEQLLSSLMGTADTMMVSNVGSAAISAVSLVDAINILVIQALSALAAGGAILCSQYLGSQNLKKAKRSAEQVLFVMLVLSCSLSLLCLIFRFPLLRLIFGTVDTDVMANSQIYFFFTLLSFPFIGLYDAGASILRAQNNTKGPMTISILSNFLNIGGNAILIFVLAWRRRRGNFHPGFPYFLCDRRDLAAEKPCRTDLCTQLLFYPSGLVFDQTRFIHRHSIRN